MIFGTTRIAAPLLAMAAVVAVGCGSGTPEPAPATPRPAAPPTPSPSPFDVRMTDVAEGVVVHTSYRGVGGEPVPSNGMAVRSGDEVFLIDTAWDSVQTVQLLDSLQARGGRVVGAMITHAHDDRAAGIGVLLERGVPVHATVQTIGLLLEQGFPRPDRPINMRAGGLTTLFGGRLRLYSPGPGHTPDNVVVYDPETGVLFGGCLVRPAGSATLGFTGDAVLDLWAASVERVGEMFEEVEVVVPGHGLPGDPSLLDHTVELVRARGS